MRDDSAEISSHFFFLQEPEPLCEQFWHGKGGQLFDVVHPAFRLPTTASPILQGALKDGFAEAVVACDMREPCKFPSLYSCQKKFLWTHEGVDFASHAVVGLELVFIPNNQRKTDFNVEW